MRRLKRVYVAGLFAVLVIGTAGLVGRFVRVKIQPVEPPAAPVTGGATESVSTFTLVGHDPTGRKKWEVQGQTADLLGEMVHLSPVAATSYGDVTVHLTAKRGQFHKSKQDVHLEEEVVVTTSDGAKMTTDSLDWAAEKGMSTTSDWVTVTRPGMKVVGKGGVGFPKLKRIRLERQITVILQGKEGSRAGARDFSGLAAGAAAGAVGSATTRPGAARNVEEVTRVTCEGPMEVDYGRRKARFWRNVQVRDAKGYILSDRMDVTLDPAVNEIQRATFWGHVKIHRPPQMAAANRANYWKTGGRVRLAGHPRLVMVPQEGQVKE